MANRATRAGSIVLTATALAAMLNTYTAAHAADPAAHRPAATGGAWWGIDTVSNVQTGNIIAQTRTDLGAPQFVGRYLIYSTELSGTEAHYIHQQGLSILLIDDPNRTFTSGTTDAHQAITQARSLGVPHGVAIFRDVETSDPITSTYIADLCRSIRWVRIRRRILREPHQRLIRGCVLLARKQQSSSGSRRAALLERAGEHREQSATLRASTLRPECPGVRKPHRGVAVSRTRIVSGGDLAERRRRRVAGAIFRRPVVSRGAGRDVSVETVLNDELVPGIVRPDTLRPVRHTRWRPRTAPRRSSITACVRMSGALRTRPASGIAFRRGIAVRVGDAP